VKELNAAQAGRKEVNQEVAAAQRQRALHFARLCLLERREVLGSKVARGLRSVSIRRGILKGLGDFCLARPAASDTLVRRRI
jgi:hypothetical protein